MPPSPCSDRARLRRCRAIGLERSRCSCPHALVAAHALVAHLALGDAPLRGVVGAIEAQFGTRKVQPYLGPLAPQLQGEHPHPVSGRSFLGLLTFPCGWSSPQVSSVQPLDLAGAFLGEFSKHSLQGFEVFGKLSELLVLLVVLSPGLP